MEAGHTETGIIKPSLGGIGPNGSEVGERAPIEGLGMPSLLRS